MRECKGYIKSSFSGGNKASNSGSFVRYGELDEQIASLLVCLDTGGLSSCRWCNIGSFGGADKGGNVSSGTNGAASIS
jgi:hypothetical protein